MNVHSTFPVTPNADEPGASPASDAETPAGFTALPLQDDMAFAVQRGLHLAVADALPMSDEYWLIGALMTADLFTDNLAWWRALGVAHPKRNTRFLRRMVQQRHRVAFQPLRVWGNSLRRFCFNVVFLDVPQERRQLDHFLATSPLYRHACEMAQRAGASRVEWVHWFQALQTHYPHYAEMLHIPPREPAAYAGMHSRIREKSWGRSAAYWLKEAVQFILIFQLVTIGVRQGLGEFRLIPSGSMEPTLQVGDRIFIEKPSSYLNLPFHRGDILVFVPPGVELRQDGFSQYLRLSGLSGFLPPLNGAFNALGLLSPLPPADEVDLAYIKRLIGLPGDWIQVVPGVGVYINGTLLHEPFQAELPLTCTLERPFRLCEPIQVPPGHVFMMGDNRNSSHDSRYWHFLPVNRIIGKAVFRFWPLVRTGPIGHEFPAQPDVTPRAFTLKP
jgi:signal peptidase I